MPAHTLIDVDTFEPEVLLRVLSDVRAGDFTARILLHWTVSAGMNANGLNEIIGANQAFGSQLERVSRVVGKEGKLSQRASFKGTDQVWGDSIESVNSKFTEHGKVTLRMERARGGWSPGHETLDRAPAMFEPFAQADGEPPTPESRS